MIVKCKILASLESSFIDVLVGYDSGHSEIVQWRIHVRHFPKERKVRMPNTILSIEFDENTYNIEKIIPFDEEYYFKKIDEYIQEKYK